MFGTAGLPHILMRFYTVPDARAARVSVFYATGFIGFFYLLTFVLGFGAMVLVGRDAIARRRPRRQHGGAAARRGARRHAVPRLHRRGRVRDDPRRRRRPHAVRRRRALARPVGERRPPRRGRANTSSSASRASRPSCSGSIAIALGIAFKGQNVAFMVGLAFAIAASANFPALLLSMFWRGFTTAGAVASMVVGTTAARRADLPVAHGADGRAQARVGAVPAAQSRADHRAARRS